MTYINKKQKAVLLVGLALFLIIGLFPPLEGEMGVAFACSPKFILKIEGNYGCGIDPLKLGILWVLVLVSTAVFMQLFRGQQPEPSSENDACEQATSGPTSS